MKEQAKVITDPVALWERYVQWLYHNEEIGLYLDVSRISFTNEFVEIMAPQVSKCAGVQSHHCSGHQH